MAPFKSTQSFSVGHFLKSFRNRDAAGPAALNSSVRTDRVENIQATGGAIETPGNGYRYHFLTLPSHTFEITENPGPVEYVLVGGGGSGGHYNGTGNSGGGGGAGGFLTGTFTDMAIGTYPVTVAVTQTNNDGTSGDEGYSTVFNSLTAYGGGAGGAANGSGGGGASGGGSGGIGPLGGGVANKMPDGTTNIPAALQPQGHAGGSQPLGNPGNAAGGGGAGGAGQNGGASGEGPGNGGDGLPAFNGDTGIPSSYGTAHPTLPGRWFAGGGSGGRFEAGARGGYGGGGHQESNSTPLTINGVANTGGGGGGGAGPADQPDRYGHGASGIVILRYRYINN